MCSGQCAVTATEQVKGYGTRLMTPLKEHAKKIRRDKEKLRSAISDTEEQAGVEPAQAAEDSEMAPAASATARAEDLAPAAQGEAADGVTAAQAAEDQAPGAEDSPHKAAAPGAVAATADSNVNTS